MASLIAVTLVDALQGGVVLKGDTLALWDGLSLVLPRAHAKAAAGHYVQIQCSEDPSAPALYAHTEFNQRAVRALAKENAQGGHHSDHVALLRELVLSEDDADFVEAYQAAFVFLADGTGPRVVERRPRVLRVGYGASLRTLTLYRTVYEGWVPHRFLVQPRAAAATPEEVHRVAQTLFPCPVEYFHTKVKMSTVPTAVDGTMYRLVCKSPLRQIARPPLRA